MKVRIEIHLDDKKEVKYLDKMATLNSLLMCWIQGTSVHKLTKDE